MITIDISFSKEFELERVLATLKNKKWFDDNNYTVSLPSNLDVESMEATIKEEYEEGAFEKPKNYVESNWGNVGLDFAEIKKTNLPFSQNYVLFLTKYGVAGSYRLPNKIIVNIKFKYEFGLIRTIIHEMIHLAIEEYVIQYKVNHWAKEQIVNLLTFKIAPKYAKVSNAKVSDQRIDDVFNSSYPDVGKIIKSVGELTSLST